MFENGKERNGKASTVFLIIFLIKISFVHGMEMDNNIINLLNSLTDMEAEPTSIFIKSCWPLYINVEFMKKASMFQVVFIDDFSYQLPINLNPNNVMFVTNLDCDSADDFVNGVTNSVLMEHEPQLKVE